MDAFSRLTFAANVVGAADKDSQLLHDVMIATPGVVSCDDEENPAN